MYGLNETAALRACLGRRGGRPAYAEPGVEFSCRSEPALRRSSSGDAQGRDGEVRIFAPDLEARPGDRVELGGANYTICEVKRLRGLRGVHHLEILAKEG